ncbi:MAG: hypothetical protein DMG78_25060 [Acidobacteria bacterium]|nr:MAG: hypothetical protein DMG78_25060 [Acidobacteriota bacterium]
MPVGFSPLAGVLALSMPLLAWGQNARPPQNPENGGDFSSNVQPLTKVPEGVILVKGAWSSASDSVTPMPEGGRVTNNVFSDPYFGISYAPPSGWTQKFEGPPPSDSGRYVLAQIRPADGYTGATRGSILITAHDMFFTPLPASNALQLATYMTKNLSADYKLEEPLTPTKIAGRPFTFYAYWSPVAQLHWYVATTQIRCHAVEFVASSRDTKLIESLLLGMDKMTLPAEAGPSAGLGGGAAPVCIKDYASDKNMTTRVEPIFTDHKFNAVPVRIIIDKKGKVKHTHFLSAFPDQAKAITDALTQWRFKPYIRDGQPVEVETGIMFGRAPRPRAPAANAATE